MAKLLYAPPAVGTLGTNTGAAVGSDYATLTNRAIQRIIDDFPVWISDSRGDDTTDNTAAIQADYDEVKTAGGGTLLLGPGVHRRGALNFDRPDLVTVRGYGAKVTTLRALGAGAVSIHGNPFTVEQHKRFGGLTILADPALPANAKGLDCGDVTNMDYDDIVIRGFKGSGGEGWVEDNEEQTERNHYRRVWIDDCTVGKVQRVTTTTPGSHGLIPNSFGYHFYEGIRFNVNNGQIGWLFEDGANMYSSFLIATMNVVDAGTCIVLRDNAQLSGLAGMLACEQTIGTGGVAYKVESNTAYAFGPMFVRFENLNGTVVDPGPHHLPHWRFGGVEAVTTNFATGKEGTLANFLGSGLAATLHPMLWDKEQDPQAYFGMAMGSNIRTPIIACYDAPGNGIVHVATQAADLAVPSQGNPGDFVKFHELGPQGHEYNNRPIPPTVAVQAAAGGGATAGVTADSGHRRGRVNVQTGTAPASGTLVHVTWATAFRSAPHVSISPLGVNAAAAVPYIVDDVSATQFKIAVAFPPAVSGLLSFEYSVIG